MYQDLKIFRASPPRTQVYGIFIELQARCLSRSSGTLKLQTFHISAQTLQSEVQQRVSFESFTLCTELLVMFWFVT